MDNDDKVTKDLARTREVFLRETPGMSAGPPKLYDVQEEFEKTRRNRSPMVAIITISFIIVFVAASAIVTYFIQKATRDVPININEFQDINLTDILDSQKQNQNDLDAAKRQLAALTQEMNAKLQAISDNASQSEEVANNQNLSPANLAARLRTIKNDESNAMAAVHAQYDPQIQALQKKVAEYQKKVDAYDTRMIAQAKKNQEVLNNQKELYQIETQNLTDYYEKRIKDMETAQAQERADLIAQKDSIVALLKKNQQDELAALTLKYNPVISEPNVTAAIGIPLPVKGPAELKPYSNTLSSEGVIAPSRFQQLRSWTTDFSTVLGRLQQVPYVNSVPDALSKLGALESNIVTSYEGLRTDLTSVVESKNQTIDQKNQEIAKRDNVIQSRDTTIQRLQYALDTNLRDSRDGGIIVDPRDSNNIMIRVNPAYPVKNGDKGYVFRSVDEFIGTIKFVVTGNSVSAQLVSLQDKSNPIQPFDKILIQLQ